MTAAPAARPLLEAKSLTKRYGGPPSRSTGWTSRVFDGITGLLGPNGAGKSTAMKLFLGLLSPTSGDAEVLGERPYENVEVRVRLGYMPEHDCLPDAITASEFLGHMAQMSGIPAGAARTRAADILRHVGLDEERYRHIKEYSTGMKQRVKLAQALVHDPVMVLLDEPTAGLDPGGREERLRLIRRTGKEFGISIMLSSHLMGDVESTCDRIIVIEGGKIIEQGAVSQFTQETETLYIDVDDRRDEVVAALPGSRDRGRNRRTLRRRAATERRAVRRHPRRHRRRRRPPPQTRAQSPPAFGHLSEGIDLTQAQGEIFDIGYQHYDGPRGGRLRAVWALWVNGFRTTLGLGRGARAKILPFGMLIATVAPAAGIVLLAAIIGPEEAVIPSHEDYYELISMLLLLFSAIIAPELLIPDRRSGVINLYLVRPLTAIDYVSARWASFLGLSLILAYSGTGLPAHRLPADRRRSGRLPPRQLARHTQVPGGGSPRSPVRHHHPLGRVRLHRPPCLCRRVHHRRVRDFPSVDGDADRGDVVRGETFP